MGGGGVEGEIRSFAASLALMICLSYVSTSFTSWASIRGEGGGGGEGR